MLLWKIKSRDACRRCARRSCEALEPRRLLAGLTIVTHGYQESVGLPPWVASMVHDIRGRIPDRGAGLTITIDDSNHDGTPDYHASMDVDSPAPFAAASGEVVAALDWSAVAGFLGDTATTGEVAQTVLAAMLNPALLPGMARPLASIPVHLIGHSRGGSLVCELAALLGERGIWVEQVTTLDPHPLSSDADLRITSNVGFADNYWHPNALSFTEGSPIPGRAFNVVLPDLAGGYALTHSDVHLWYAGTIATDVEVNDGDKVLTSAMRADWYTTTEQNGVATGFNLSRLSGHGLNTGFYPYDRDSAEIVHFGLSELLGGSGLRTEVATTNPWPNLLDVNATLSGSSAVAGRWLDVDYTTAGTSWVRVQLNIDVDANPFNGNEVYYDTIEHQSLLSTPQNHSARLPTTGIAPGTYYITASIIDMGLLNQRYISSSPFTISAPPAFHIASDRGVSGVADASGGIAITGIDGLSRPLVFQEHAGQWHASDLQTATGSPAIFGEVVTWIDPKDGLNYAAAPSLNGLMLYRQSSTGAWSYQNLTAQILGATRLTDKLAAFVSVGGTVMIAGIDEGGDFVLYAQSAAGGTSGWTFRNITTLDLEPQGLRTPGFASSLTGFVTPWDAWNVAGLDYAGQIQAFWIHPASMSQWSQVNLSALYGAPQLTGELTVYQTSWNAINLIGTDESGRVSATWWLPEFGAEWRTSNLTDIIGGPRLQESTLASFVTPWGAMNIAGVAAGTGATVVYWWTPESGAWQIAPLSETIAGADRMAGRVAGLTTALNELNLVGQSASGELIRYYWNPSNPWRFESITDAV